MQAALCAVVQAWKSYENYCRVFPFFQPDNMAPTILPGVKLLAVVKKSGFMSAVRQSNQISSRNMDSI